MTIKILIGLEKRLKTLVRPHQEDKKEPIRDKEHNTSN